MINGVINVYKPAGFTSNDVIAKMRGIVHQRKLGHTGTLDPEAVGVLPVCLGSGTKLCDMLTDHDKEYEAVLRLGVSTDTQDMTGEVLSTREVTCTEQEAVRVINSFIGLYRQIPPMYSAKKVNGKKLYELAREGKEVEREPQEVTIHNIVIEDISLPVIRMRVMCSKGTYIRTLCHDIGEMLGCGGAMESLKRTRVGVFSIENSVTMERIEQLVAEDNVMSVVTPVDKMFEGLGEVVVADAYKKIICNGNIFNLKHMLGERRFNSGEDVRVYDEQGKFYGIYTFVRPINEFRPKKMFLSED